MKRERREKLTRKEWEEITSRRPVVRKIPAPEKKPHSPGPTAPGLRGPGEGGTGY